MYIPRSNLITDNAALHDLMRRFSFAILVTTREGHSVATHLPFLVYSEGGEHGRLVAHMARANPQWTDFAPAGEVLVIFQGDHTYISPSWYADHPSVPTWNYMIAHAYGIPQIITDEARIRASLSKLVATHEAGFDEPWPIDVLPDDYLRTMMRGIVAFEIPIARLEGKFKLSQNRSEDDQRRVIAGLEESSDRDTEGVRAAMLDRLGLT